MTILNGEPFFRGTGDERWSKSVLGANPPLIAGENQCKGKSEFLKGERGMKGKRGERGKIVIPSTKNSSMEMYNTTHSICFSAKEVKISIKIEW